MDHRILSPEAADSSKVARRLQKGGPRYDDLDPACGQFSGDPEGLPVPEILPPVVLGVEVPILRGVGGFLRLLFEIRPEFFDPEMSALGLIQVGPKVERLLNTTPQRKGIEITLPQVELPLA
jgi:hypothetical protein